MSANYAEFPGPRKSLDPLPIRRLILGVANDELIDHLATLRMLAGVPRDQLVWIAEHGVRSRLEQDGVLATKGSPMLGFFIVLEGHLAIRVDRGPIRREDFPALIGDCYDVTAPSLPPRRTTRRLPDAPFERY